MGCSRPSPTKYCMWMMPLPGRLARIMPKAMGSRIRGSNSTMARYSKAAHADHHGAQPTAGWLNQSRNFGKILTRVSINQLSYSSSQALKRRGVVYAGLAPAILPLTHCLCAGVLAAAHCMDSSRRLAATITGDALLYLRSGRSLLYRSGSGLCGGCLRSSLGGLLLGIHRVEDLALQRDDSHQQHGGSGTPARDTSNGNDHTET